MEDQGDLRTLPPQTLAEAGPGARGQLLRRLDDLARPQQLLIFRNLPADRLRRLVSRLLVASRTCGFDDASRSLSLAALALAAVEARAAGRQWLALRAEALAEHANALRRLGGFDAAHGRWEEIDRLRLDDEVPLRLRGHLHSLRASLYADETLLGDAKRALDAATVCFLHDGSRDDRARVSLKQAILLHEQGKTVEALRATWAVVRQLTPADSRWTRLVALHNLAGHAVALGHGDCAEQIDRLAAPLYCGQGAAVRLRRDWLRGQRLAGRGRVAAARDVLTTARTGFAERCFSFSARRLDEELARLAEPPNGDLSKCYSSS